MPRVENENYQFERERERERVKMKQREQCIWGERERRRDIEREGDRER